MKITGPILIELEFSHYLKKKIRSNKIWSTKQWTRKKIINKVNSKQQKTEWKKNVIEHGYNKYKYFSDNNYNIIH